MVTKAERYARDYGEHAEWIRGQPCLVCYAPRCHPHHVRSRGAGGSRKDLVPLCAEHHLEVHQIGRDTFEARHDLDLGWHSRKMWLQSLHGANAEEVIGVPV